MCGIYALPIHNHEENSAAKARLITALTRGRLIGMTGAGLSYWAGYPLWKGALDHLAAFATHVTGNTQKVADLVVENQDDTLHCAQRLGQLVGEEEFAAFLGKEFGPNGKTPPNILRHFALLPLRHVLTFNFDTSCEAAHQDTAVEFQSLSIGNRDDLIGFFREMDDPDCVKTIFHLHGRFNDPLTNIVFTENRYRQLYSEGIFSHHFRNLAITKRLLFVGFGFTDKDVETAFRESARLVQAQMGDEPVNYHFAIIGVDHEHDDRTIRQNMSDRYLADAVFYNVRRDNNHEEFGDLLKELIDALHVVVPIVAQTVEPPHEMVAIEDLQRMEAFNDRFLLRVDRGQEND